MDIMSWDRHHLYIPDSVVAIGNYSLDDYSSEFLFFAQRNTSSSTGENREIEKQRKRARPHSTS